MSFEKNYWNKPVHLCKTIYNSVSLIYMSNCLICLVLHSFNVKVNPPLAELHKRISYNQCSQHSIQSVILTVDKDLMIQILNS